MPTFGPKTRPDAQLGPGLSKGTEAVLAELMAGTRLSRRQKESVLGAAGRGTLPRAKECGSKALKRPASTWRRGPGFAPADPCVVPGSFSGKKMAPAIERDAAPSCREQFAGAAPGRDNDAEKDRLARRFEFAHLSRSEHAARERQRAEVVAGRGPREPAPPPAPPGPSQEEDAMADAIMGEIGEREAFLEDMRARGAGGRYEAQVKAEVAARVNQLKTLRERALRRAADLRAGG